MQESAPDALSCVLNLLARQFIEACISVRGGGRASGSRPSAAELLTHEFLAEEHPDDDDEVVLGGWLYCVVGGCHGGICCRLLFFSSFSVHH